jgi:hypothetical protein
MKIGFSFGRCLGSIVRGEVAFDDVLCLIARTRMETEAQVRGVVEVYMHRHGYLTGSGSNSLRRNRRSFVQLRQDS